MTTKQILGLVWGKYGLIGVIAIVAVLVILDQMYGIGLAEMVKSFLSGGGQ